MNMNSTKKKVLAGGLAVALAAGIGLSVTPAGASDSPSSTTTVQTPANGPQQGAKRHHRLRRLLKEHRREIGTSLAKALDISVDQLKAAVKQVRSERPEGGFDSPQARRTWRQEHLASALGITVEQLQAAVKTAATDLRAAN